MKPALLLLLALALPMSISRAESYAAPDLSGTTDASIRDVLRIVARHQLRPLKDGDYPAPDKIATVLHAKPPEGIAWNYPWGVTLYGVLRSTDATGDTDALNFVLEHNRIVARDYAWLASVAAKFGGHEEIRRLLESRDKDKIRGLMALGNLDSCGAMGVQLAEAVLRYPDKVTAEQKLVLERIADWIVVKQDRLPDGTLWRPERRDARNVWPNGTIWADDLYMACPYLVRWSAFTHDGKYLADAARQVINMAERLQDKDGLWFHAYCESKHENCGWKWGRANGWIMVATAEILSAMPENHPDRLRLLEIFRQHVAGVKKVQPASGVWHQVLDRDELWEETSCTMMFAYAIARGANRGWLPASDMQVARKAFAGVCAHSITPEGVVKGTCEGTSIGLTLDYYKNRRRPDDDYHGRGVVLLAGTEILNPMRQAEPN